MHEEAFKFCADMAIRTGQHLPEQGYALDIGGMDFNGTARTLWPDLDWLVIDPIVKERMGVESAIVDDTQYLNVDALDWIPQHTYDLVLCTEVFEHTPNWLQIIAKAHEALQVGGYFVLTCAAIGREPHSITGEGYPQPGEWYKNLNPVTVGDALHFSGFESWIIYNPVSSDLYAYGIKKK